MELYSKLLIALVFFTNAPYWIEAVPARVRVGDEPILTPPNSEPDVVLETTEGDSGGVLGRLWSGISTFTGFSKSPIEERLQRFHRDLLNKWHTNMKLLSQESRRYRRNIEDGLPMNTDGSWMLTGMDANVHQRLKSLDVPSAANSVVMFEHQTRVFWIATYLTGINVYSFDIEGTVTETAWVGSQEAMKCNPVLKTANFIEIVCAESLDEGSRTGSSAYRITWAEGLAISFVRSFPTHKAKDVVSWEINNKVYIAFANSLNLEQNTVESVNKVYQMEPMTISSDTFTNYDKLDSSAFLSSNAFGLEAFKIMNKQFLAVANHKDDRGNVEVDSEIFIYDAPTGRTKPFQRIRTSAARDWAAFSFTQGNRAEFFLAVANEYRLEADFSKNYDIESVVYRYDEMAEKFVPFQCITTSGARQLITYQGPNGELLLAIVNYRSGVAFYQYNGWRFIRINLDATFSEAGVKWAWMGYLQNVNQALFMMSSEPKSEQYYALFTYKNPLGVYHNATAHWCKTYKATMLDDGLTRMVTAVQNAPKTNESQTFQNRVFLNGDLTLGQSKTPSQVGIIVDQSNSLTVDYAFHGDTATLLSNYTKLATFMNELNRTASTAKTLNSPDLNGLHFEHLVYRCNASNCTPSVVDSLTAERVNGVSASYEGIALLNNTDVPLNLTFSEVALAGGAKANVSYIKASDTEAIPVRDFVCIHLNYNISGNVTFTDILTDNLEATGLVDSMSVSNKTLLLTVGKQKISGQVTVESVNTTMISAVNVNGREFTPFIESLVVNGSQQTFTGPLEVREFEAPKINISQPMVPLDPVSVSTRALLHTTNETQNVTAYHKIELLQTTDLTLNKLNGVVVPDDIFLTYENASVTIPTTFGELTAETINITKSINNVQQKDGKLQFLLLREDATLSNKTFVNLTFESHLTVGKKVAGSDLDYLANGVYREFVRQLDNGRTINGSVTFEKNLNITSDLLGNANITKIRDEAILLTATSISTPLVFEEPVLIEGDLLVNQNVNNRAKEEYVLLNSNTNFSGALMFTTDVRCNDHVIAAKVSDLDLLAFDASVVKINGGPQTIVQDLTLNSATMDDLDVLGESSIGGVLFDDVVPLNGTTVVGGFKNFTTLEVRTNATANAVKVGDFGKVDGVFLHEIFFGDSLRKSKKEIQTLAGRSLHSLNATNITGTDMAAFERRVVYKDEMEKISGSLTLKGSVSVNKLTFNGDFDGISEATYKSGWLLKNGSQTLTGRNTLANATAKAVAFQASHIAGVDINHLYRETAKIDEQTTLYNVTFDQIVSTGDVMVDGTIQGWHLKEQALLSSSSFQEVTGRKNFTAPVHINGTVSFSDKLVVLGESELEFTDMDAFCNSFMQQGKVLKELIVKGNAVFDNVLNVNKTFNMENVETLNKTFWLSDRSYSLNSVANFTSVAVADPAHVIVKGMVNSKFLDLVDDRILRNKCVSQTLTGSWTLKNVSTVTVKTDSVLNTLNDSDVFLANNILRTDTDQVISGRKSLSEIKVRGSVNLNGTLNSLNVSTDYVQYNKPAVIRAAKTFAGLHIIKNLTIAPTKLVQGVDISELAQEAVMHAGNGSTKAVSGKVIFKTLIVKNLNVSGTVDTVNVHSSSILLTSGQQTVKGKVTIKADHTAVIAKNLTIQDKKFNEVDLERLNLDAVRTTGNATTITKEVTFTSTPTFSNITIQNQLVNGYNLTDLVLALNGKHTLANMGDLLEEAIKASQDTNLVLGARPTELWYFHETEIPHKLNKLQPVTLKDPLDAEPDAFVGINTNKSQISIYGPNIMRTSLADLLQHVCEKKEPLNILATFPENGNMNIESPVAVTGMGNFHLAVCGNSPKEVSMPATETHKKIPDELNKGTNLGYIWNVVTNMKELTFQTSLCKDLVTFPGDSGDLCLAVLDYEISASLICGKANSGYQLSQYIETARALKGASVILDSVPFLFILEDHDFSFASKLKIFKYENSQLKLAFTHELRRASYMDALAIGSEAYVALTIKGSYFSAPRVDLYKVMVQSGNINMKRIKTFPVAGALSATLSRMAKYELGIFIQTEHSIHLYIMKGISISFDREILTVAARHPVSFPFFNSQRNTTFIAFAPGTDILPDAFGNHTSRTYEAIYRPN